ncbi:phosphatase PAP2 family protein [Nocardioides pacificus]
MTITRRPEAAPRPWASARTALAPSPRLRRGLLELAVLASLYVAYSASRLVADDAFEPAHERAIQLLHLERLIGLDIEVGLNQWFAAVSWAGLAASYWYATAHYVVTLVALVWLYLRGRAAYVPARTALLAATVLGLVMYLLLPTAPPRLVDGYVDVLHLHAADGWWGADASAPKGLGDLTNQLAAFPSLHAGWALWVAIVVHREVRHPLVRSGGWLYALVTAIVIVGTGNHWVLDAVVGWLVVLAGFWLADRWAARRPLVDA